MKKIILSAAALFAFGFANAQDATNAGGKGFANGDIFISGAVGINSESTGDIKENAFTIAPSVGFFVSDNIAVGGRIGYTSLKSEEPGVDDITESELAIGAFGRYYATPASDFSLFAELGVEYASAKVEQGPAELTVNGFGVALAPGISYFVGSNWAIEASIAALSYSSVKPDVDGAEATNNFGLNVDFSNIRFGVVYKF